ncbi:alcohol dehydrogenase [Haloarcula vallismortis]|uniref:Alcohol dehydrogenase n=2 Tax=Haloarcula vallismortis TaxID=28442 RepID=A0A1H2ZGW5_HALVA|nr:zinc-binding alcohol dehydrogenase [Haloarcula vallismortis]EMA04576.1 putative zinc-binding dehydrogenase [Haloarcula vallismortis ATCC 29715]SDX16713.1 alcohol dehydrogenase [Haloarcula vallismortis]
MFARTLYFTGAESVRVDEEAVPDPGPSQVRVRTELSGISPGTELLVYRGEIDSEFATDETIDALDGTFSYPLQYGYAAIGRVTAIGDEVDDSWLDRRVFAFNPHESHFLAEPSSLIPTTLPPEQAVFIPNVEAAVNFVMDARPRIGARVVVFGQGPVGLLTTGLLADFPLASLVTVDPCASRRQLSEALGADRSVSPENLGDTDADITFELSGNPPALDRAIDATGYAGQVIVGSWYGSKGVSLDLGHHFHRSHIRVRSSQVSRIDPDHADRWDKDRRLDVVRSWLSDTDLSALLTHEIDIERAGDAYQLLSNRPDDAVQVVLTYS